MSVRVLLTAALALAALGSGCATDRIPGIYRIDIQQGNVVTREMLDRIEPGMEQRRVRLLLGTPLIVDPFNQDRWDYVYSFARGRGRPVERRISLHFVQGRLDRIDGDLDAVPREHAEDQPPEQVVTVPQREEKGGFLRSLTPGFLRRDEPREAPQPTASPAEPAEQAGDATAPPTEPGTPAGDPTASELPTATPADAPATPEPVPPDGTPAATASATPGDTPETTGATADQGFLRRLFSGFRSTPETPATTAAEDPGAGASTTATPDDRPGASDTAEPVSEDGGFFSRLMKRFRRGDDQREQPADEPASPAAPEPAP